MIGMFFGTHSYNECFPKCIGILLHTWLILVGWCPSDFPNLPCEDAGDADQEAVPGHLQGAEQAVQGPEEPSAGGRSQERAQGHLEEPKGGADAQAGHAGRAVRAQHQRDDGIPSGTAPLFCQHAHNTATPPPPPPPTHPPPPPPHHTTPPPQPLTLTSHTLSPHVTHSRTAVVGR